MSGKKKVIKLEGIIKGEIEWAEIAEKYPELADALAQNVDLSKLKMEKTRDGYVFTVPSHLYLNIGTMAFGKVVDEGKEVKK